MLLIMLLIQSYSLQLGTPCTFLNWWNYRHNRDDGTQDKIEGDEELVQ